MRISAPFLICGSQTCMGVEVKHDQRCAGWQALTGKHASPAAAAEHLERMFSEDSKTESKRVTVLLVDEMDLLITKKQQVAFSCYKASYLLHQAYVLWGDR